MNPFTEIILKKTAARGGEKLLFLYHPIDLRNQLKLTSHVNIYPRDISRNYYPNIVSNALVLINYEE